MHEYIKYLFVENLIVTIIVIFVVLYIYFNMDIVNSGDYFNGSLSLPITYTCIIVLIGLVMVEYCKDKMNNNNDVLLDTLNNKNGGNEKKYKIIAKDKDIFISSKNKHMFGLNM